MTKKELLELLEKEPDDTLIFISLAEDFVDTGDKLKAYVPVTVIKILSHSDKTVIIIAKEY